MPIGAGPWNPWAPVDTSVDTSGLTPSQLGWFNYLTRFQDVPARVAQSIVSNPSYEDGTGAPSGWPSSYRGQGQEEAQEPQGQAYEYGLTRQFRGNRRPGARDISYQPGASAMAGGWDQGGGSPGQSQMSPDDVKRWQTVMRLLGSRGMGGMQPSSASFTGPQGWANFTNQLSNPGQQGLMGQLVQNPDLLRYLMGMQGQQQFPTSGGGVDLGGMMQALGFPSR